MTTAHARLIAALGQGLPGHDDFFVLESSPPRRTVPAAMERGCRLAAALVLCYPHLGTEHVVLTIRSHSLTNHPNQISLPGGKIDPGETAEDAALREAWEEIAVPTDAVAVLDALTPVYIPPTNFCLFPILGWAHERPDFRPREAEVAGSIEVPLNDLVRPTARRAERRPYQGSDRRVPFFELGSHQVWGATALVLSELAALWRRALALD